MTTKEEKHKPIMTLKECMEAEQPLEAPTPDYTPSWYCRIAGHKWWLRNVDERFDENGTKHRDIKQHETTHCDRCGVKNPRVK